MTKIKWSKEPDEWYCSYGKCCNCNTEFMCSKAHYCPGCGEKIESEEFNVSRKEMEDKNMTREEILSKAKECVCGQREQDYGSPEHNFQLIADLWTDYLGRLISTTDVAMMMALLKIARIKNGGGTGDSFVDLAGYAACGGELNAIYKGKESSDLKKTLDDAWNEGTGLFSKAYNEDDKNKRYCDNCRWKDEKSDGEHCDTCCHNDTSSKESHWVNTPKGCSNCLYKNKCTDDHPCNKCILNGHDEFRWVSDGDEK